MVSRDAVNGGALPETSRPEGAQPGEGEAPAPPPS
jgi:hypothetical protein